MEMDGRKPFCPIMDVDGVVSGGKQFDLDITLPEDNRDVIYGVIRDCFKEPVRDAVIKLTEIVYDCGKEERRPIGHTFTDEEGEFVFGPLCPDRHYAIQIWANTTKKINVCAKCHHEGKCLKGEKHDKCDCFIDEKKPCHKEDKYDYFKDDKKPYYEEDKCECFKDDKKHEYKEDKCECFKDDKKDDHKEDKCKCFKDDKKDDYKEDKCKCFKDDKKDDYKEDKCKCFKDDKKDDYKEDKCKCFKDDKKDDYKEDKCECFKDDKKYDYKEEKYENYKNKCFRR